jgi:hypothetical protein
VSNIDPQNCAVAKMMSPMKTGGLALMQRIAVHSVFAAKTSEAAPHLKSWQHVRLYWSQRCYAEYTMGTFALIRKQQTEPYATFGVVLQELQVLKILLVHSVRWDCVDHADDTVRPSQTKKAPVK